MKILIFSLVGICFFSPIVFTQSSGLKNKEVVKAINKYTLSVSNYESEEYKLESIDLNGDGSTETIARDLGSGNQWGAWFIVSSKPYRIIFDCDGCVSYPEILRTKTKGWYDIMQGDLRFVSGVFIWDGKKYKKK